MTTVLTVLSARAGIVSTFARPLARLIVVPVKTSASHRATADPFAQRHLCSSARRSAITLPAARPPAEPGQRISEIETPALLVDLQAFDNNCRQLKQLMDAKYPNVLVRPHAKAHKCPQLALRQLDILGARAPGICCQKAGEVEALAAAGLGNILLSNEVVSKRKLQRLVDLAASGVHIGLCVDNSASLALAAELAAAAGTQLRVLVEVNVGQDRCGVDTPAEVVQLARQAIESPGCTFDGIQAYQGALQHVRRPEDRAQAVSQVVSKVKDVLAALDAAGIACLTVTGGGSGTFTEEASSGVFTEVQPGSFAFGDADYQGNDGWCWEQSLWLLGTVMSRNEAAGRAVLDTGLKAVSLDSGPPVLPAKAGEAPLAEFVNGGDEHGVLLMCQADATLPGLGEMVRLIPGHVDPTFNMYDWVVATRGDVVEHVWPITGRGPGI